MFAKVAPVDRGEVLWELVGGSRLHKFAKRHGFETYADLHAWSITDLEGFWGAVVDDLGIRWATPPDRVLGDDSMPGARWFPGATLNYADHALSHPGTRESWTAVIAHSQTRDPI